MTIADSLGMPEPAVKDCAVEETAEDRMLLPIGLLFEPEGRWYTTYMTREDLKPILSFTNIKGIPIFDGRSVFAIRICEIEGPECNLQFIYDFIIQQWRLE